MRPTATKSAQRINATRPAEAGTVSVRARESDRGDLGAIPLDTFMQQAQREVETFGKQIVNA